MLCIMDIISLSFTLLFEHTNSDQKQRKRSQNLTGMTVTSQNNRILLHFPITSRLLYGAQRMVMARNSC